VKESGNKYLFVLVWLNGIPIINVELMHGTSSSKTLVRTRRD